MSAEALRKLFNQTYGTELKSTSFHYHTKRLGLSKHIEHRYTAEEDEFLKENSPLMSRPELTKAFNSKFNTSISVLAIEMRCYLKKFEPADNGQFKVGGCPWDRLAGGREEYINRLKNGKIGYRFSKGNVPVNISPIGSTRRHRNNIYIKTADGKGGWKTILVAAWEKIYGEIPKGYRVFAVDGNNENTDIQNLRCIDNYTTTVLMSNGWLDKGADIFDAGVQYANLMKVLKQNNILPVEDDD